MSHPDRETFWFGLAAQYATRATCPRASIGAVLVKFDRIIAAGFNGAPSGEAHCLERDQTLQQHLALRHCEWALHAERNALRNAFVPADGATLYVVGPRPVCPNCRDYLASRGVNDIRHRGGVATLDSLAREIRAWGAATFPLSGPDSTAEHLAREVEELRDDPYDGEELADVFHLVIQLARVANVDLVAEAARKFAINRSRVWQAPDAAGVVEHVRDEVPS
jgi:dCMP deaminase